MKDEQMQSLLDAWYREREVPRPEVQTGVSRVMANVHQTRQLRGWWPFLRFRRTARTHAAADGTRTGSGTSLAVDGHALTNTGRTRLMLSPVKAIAGALVFALGGLFLVSQQFAQAPDARPGAQSTDQPGAEVAVGSGVTYFTGTAECTSEEGERSSVDGVIQVQIHSTCELVTEDDRLNGTAEIDNTIYSFGPSGGPWTSESELVTDVGSWSGSGQGVYDRRGSSPLGTPGETFRYGNIEYIGKGAYEGLVAHYYLAGNDDMSSLTGWISGE